MNRKNFLCIMAAIAFVTTELAGCKPAELPDASSLLVQNADSEMHTFQQSFPNGFQVDASYTPPVDMSLDALPVVPADFFSFIEDPQELVKILAPGQTVTTMQGPQEVYQLINGEYYKNFTCTTQDGMKINGDNIGILSAETPLSENIQWAYIDPNTDGGLNSNASVFEKEELSSYRKQEAIDAAKSILAQLHLNCVGPTKVVALDHETLQQEEQDPQEVAANPETAPKKKGIWTEEDECYALYFAFDVEGIPIVKDTVVHDEQAIGPYIRVLYGKQGLVQLDVQAYQPTSDAESTVSACELEPVLQSVIEEEKSIDLSQTQRVLQSISLQYAVRLQDPATLSFAYRPVWCFKFLNTIPASQMHATDSSTSSEETYNTISYTYADAETGHILT